MHKLVLLESRDQVSILVFLLILISTLVQTKCEMCDGGGGAGSRAFLTPGRLGVKCKADKKYN